MRRFQLHRDTDISGVSGTGVVAEGVEFSSGEVTLRWFGPHASTADFRHLTDLLFVHGHAGSTRVVWLDPP